MSKIYCQFSVFTLVWAQCSLAAFPQTPDPEEPVIAAASAEGQRAIAGIKRPENWQANLFAAEPLLANPVAFYIDFQGKVFVCESFRQSKGIEDNRGHAEWLDEDLAAQTVEDRLAYIQGHLKEKSLDYTRHDDRIRLLRDTNNDGVADTSTVFADHFNTIVSGSGAGVLSYRGNVYYTCIPDLWMLQDADGDDRAEIRKSLHYGFGVRFAFRGHDLHGLTIGPDGRIYFSIGDRGYNVRTQDQSFINPESGGVFRCELDGSNLEVLATGLRNPQELAFDDYGNLFTGDNNSDSGDQARWVYVVEGGDSGWRMAYQYFPDRGPFNREKIWQPFHPGQPAYIVPPVDNLADGPSGLVYYPGTGLGDDYQGRFFLCDFRGQASNSGVRTFRVKQKGAFFELLDSEQTVWNLLVTDVDFGPDGSLYVSDWVQGWEGLNKGRIYRFTAQDRDEQIVKEVQQILRGGLADADEKKIVALFAHADRRVRLEAQFELVRRGSLTSLLHSALQGESQFARLHGMWGIGQMYRSKKIIGLTADLDRLLHDDDPEIRAQAAKLAGDIGAREASDQLIRLLADKNARVRFLAAMAVGKLQLQQAIPAIAKMLEENDNLDPIVRHGGVMALANIGDVSQIHELTHSGSVAVRLAAIVALRRLQDEGLGLSLQDPSALVVVEAARAIHDLPIISAYPALADLIDTGSTDDALLRRVLNANFRLGTEQNVQNLVRYVSRNDAPTEMRLEAIGMLANWSEPSGRDRVLGMWRPLGKRDVTVVTKIVRENLPLLLASAPAVSVEAVKLAAKLGIREVTPEIIKTANNTQADAAIRADSLRALETLKYQGLPGELEKFARDPQPLVRIAVRDVMSRLDADKAVAMLAQALQAGATREQQAAWQTIRNMKSDKTAALLADSLKKMIAGDLTENAQLDLLLAAEASPSHQVKKLLAEYRAAKPPNDPLADYAETLHGGYAELGAKIFYENASVSCLRCHKVDGRGGEVGPDLSKIAVDKDRQYLLESIVIPNQTIAKGFETIIVDTLDGLSYTGIVKEETDDTLTLLDAEGRTKRIAKADIDERSNGESAMPKDLIKQLSQEDIRNLVEWLANLKGQGSAAQALK